MPAAGRHWLRAGRPRSPSQTRPNDIRCVRLACGKHAPPLSTPPRHPRGRLCDCRCDHARGDRVLREAGASGPRRALLQVPRPGEAEGRAAPGLARAAAQGRRKRRGGRAWQARRGRIHQIHPARGRDEDAGEKTEAARRGDRRADGVGAHRLAVAGDRSGEAQRAAAGGEDALVLPAGEETASPGKCRRQQSDRRLHPREAGARGPEALAARGRAHAYPPCDPRSHRPAADAR